MRFYNNPHLYYCGIDRHARTMYVCILNREGEVVRHRNMASTPECFRKALAAYRQDMVVAVECLFTWYWLADLCGKEKIPFVLGHVLYMKAIHGGQAQHDQIDTHKIGCTAAWRHDPDVLCLSSQDASHARSAATPYASDA